MKNIVLMFIAACLFAQTASKLPAVRPYSAEERTEQIRGGAGGVKKTAIISTAHVYRDSKGRTRRDVTFTDPAGGGAKRTAITISDVVAGVRYDLDPVARTAYREALAPAPTGRGGGAEGERRAGERREGEGGRGEGGRGEGGRGEGGKGGGEGERREPGRGEREPRKDGGEGQRARKHEDLGIKPMLGLNAHGSRNTVTSQNGQVIDERWVSVDLGVDLKSSHSDASGQTIRTLTEIKRAEPAAALFQVPAGYTVKQRAQ